MTFSPPIRALILDMDGVLWHDNLPLGNLPEIFEKIRALHLRVMLATNNSTRTPADYLQKLRGFGVELEPWQVVNSSMATAAMLRAAFPQGGEVYVVGESGILSALRDAGFIPFTGGTRPAAPVAVVAGMDTGITYEKLAIATQFISSGVPFFGTNPDRTYPTPYGLAPGAGTILAALEAATDVKPKIGGKPEPYLFRLALERMNVSASETLVVGDRLETDIEGGRAAGCKTALVLSGVTSRARAEANSALIDLLCENLGEVVAALSES